MPDETGRAARVRSKHKTIHIILLCVVVVAMLFFAATDWLRS